MNRRRVMVVLRDHAFTEPHSKGDRHFSQLTMGPLLRCHGVFCSMNAEVTAQSYPLADLPRQLRIELRHQRRSSERAEKLATKPRKHEDECDRDLQLS